MIYAKTSTSAQKFSITDFEQHLSSSKEKYGQAQTVRDATNGSFQKHDTGKLRYSLIPTECTTEMCRVFMHGAKIYGDYNWEECTDPLRYYDAAQRHMHKWRSGEDVDAESGLTHLGHATACLFILFELQRRLGDNDGP